MIFVKVFSFPFFYFWYFSHMSLFQCFIDLWLHSHMSISQCFNERYHKIDLFMWKMQTLKPCVTIFLLLILKFVMFCFIDVIMLCWVTIIIHLCEKWSVSNRSTSWCFIYVFDLLLVKQHIYMFMFCSCLWCSVHETW